MRIFFSFLHLVFRILRALLNLSAMFLSFFYKKSKKTQVLEASLIILLTVNTPPAPLIHNQNTHTAYQSCLSLCYKPLVLISFDNVIRLMPVSVAPPLCYTPIFFKRLISNHSWSLNLIYFNIHWLIFNQNVDNPLKVTLKLTTID